ncbi:MAG TPA: response regulator [Anaerolineales bacterium]|nr:response regulator [Anaerolineales bacterium]
MTHLNMIEILLVEDNPRDAELTLRALTKNNVANRVFHVEDGEEALDFLLCRGKYTGQETARSPRVVLLDLKLPKLGGLEVLRAIRADERTRTIPVVVITSSSEDPDIANAYDLGANSYVVKPVNFDAFMNVVNSLSFYWLMVNHPR